MSNTLIAIGIVSLTVVVMEGLAWVIHKYILHGPLWFIHITHHRPHAGFFETNDVVSVFYALLSAALIVYGDVVNSFLLWVGVGIAVYGVLYFFLHDVVIHQRIRFSYKFGSRYLKRLIRAHKIHHKSLQRTDAEAFGFLYAAKKYQP
jgi:beta-carotene 3-hydroxylase